MWHLNPRTQHDLTQPIPLTIALKELTSNNASGYLLLLQHIPKKNTDSTWRYIELAQIFEQVNHEKVACFSESQMEKLSKLPLENLNKVIKGSYNGWKKHLDFERHQP